MKALPEEIHMFSSSKYMAAFVTPTPTLKMYMGAYFLTCAAAYVFLTSFFWVVPRKGSRGQKPTHPDEMHAEFARQEALGLLI
jgi:hypothetical protein